MNAFRTVIAKRQTRFRQVIEWLDEKIKDLRLRDEESMERMRSIVTSSIN